MSVVAVERIDVDDGVLSVRVAIADARYLRTAGRRGLPERVVGVLPGLSRHRCENGTAHGLLTELLDTETPHLLEHVAAEIMALAGSPRTLKGRTMWDFARDGAGHFTVTLEYDDDLVALGALKAAGQVVDWLFDEGPEPDVGAEVGRLRELRER